ncbi:hypothetical protein NE237_008253 [Protea cynaroides]|uniref:Uncharacterized protein n=1 Tax=Protea cynaroides TaxID=273540 RepID=A0A9Q0GP41_9MAGN|nr:hypothetical protein NE237_008253 [Protea cynaroides]
MGWTESMDNALIDLLVEEPTGNFSVNGLDFQVDGQEDTVGDGVEAYYPSSVDQYFEDVSEVAASMSTQRNQNISSSSRKHGKSRVNDDLVDILGVMTSKIGKIAEALTQGDESASTFSDRLYKDVMKR